MTYNKQMKFALLKMTQNKSRIPRNEIADSSDRQTP